MTILNLQERKLEKHWLLCNGFPELNHSLQEAGEAHVNQAVNKKSQVWQSGNLEGSPRLLPTFMERVKSDWERRPQTTELQRRDFGDLLSCLWVLQRAAGLHRLWAIICVGWACWWCICIFNHPRSCKQATFTHTLVKDTNKNLTVSPIWTLMPSLLWSLMGSLSELSKWVHICY